MPTQRSGQSARTRAPREPRAYLRSIEKLTRVRGPDGRTLQFTFAQSTGGSRKSAAAFVKAEHVPDFEGDAAWFEMEQVERGNGHLWPWWRAVRQVEPPADA